MQAKTRCPNWLAAVWMGCCCLLTGGCLAAYTTRPVEVLVTDCDTGVPKAGIPVVFDYAYAGVLNPPGRAEGTTNNQGTVVLPVHLSWHQFREFDVARQRPRLLLYSIILGQGRRNDVARFLNAQRLREDWPQLRLLIGSRMRRACERKLGLPRELPHRGTDTPLHMPG